MRTENEAMPRQLTRRAVLHRSSLLIAGASGAALSGCSQLQPGGDKRSREPLRVGLVTDIHYADKPPGGSRHYRDSLTKLATSVDQFNAANADCVIELGDFIDAAESVDEELAWLERIETVYARARCPRYHVLGNHCVFTLTKEQFLDHCATAKPYYSFDLGGYHFIILDACFREDGAPYGNRNFKWTDANIPPAELEWLTADLETTRKPALVFVHQRLDVDNHYGVRNQADVRAQLEASGNVLAVFQGHNHINDLKEIHGIHYCTLAAMVEGPAPDHTACGLMELSGDGSIRIDGFGQQVDRLIA